MLCAKAVTLTLLLPAAEVKDKLVGYTFRVFVKFVGIGTVHPYECWFAILLKMGFHAPPLFEDHQPLANHQPGSVQVILHCCPEVKKVPDIGYVTTPQHKLLNISSSTVRIIF